MGVKTELHQWNYGDNVRKQLQRSQACGGVSLAAQGLCQWCCKPGHTRFECPERPARIVAYDNRRLKAMGKL